MTATRVPANVSNAYRAMFLDALSGPKGTATLAIGIPGCERGKATADHPCEPGLWGQHPDRKVRAQYLGAAIAANLDADGKVRCGNATCGGKVAAHADQRLTAQLAHVHPREDGGGFCGRNLILVCSTVCNHAVELDWEAVRDDYNLFHGRLTTARGLEVKGKYT